MSVEERGDVVVWQGTPHATLAADHLRRGPECVEQYFAGIDPVLERALKGL